MPPPAGTSSVMTPLPEVNSANVEATLASPVPVLLEFGARWCPPCRMLAPQVEAIAAHYAGRLRVATCDTDESPDLATRFNIRSVPTLLLFKSGQVVGQLVGAVPRARLESLLARAGVP
ncbi:MAG TPA: thioredoxin domain-containing protein [Myxococcota bacterium]|jgi:thioredoxin|nr:thioredoxin domain-containing protein [Myxococcota bacterium]